MTREQPFDGITFDPKRDLARMSSQLDRVCAFMSDGHWDTLGNIAAAVGGSEAGVSARLRDLRKDRHGSLNVERKNVGGGCWMYRIGQITTATE